MPEPKKFKHIDSLRGIAILLVLIIHNGQHGTSLDETSILLDKLTTTGRYGVQLFFLMSAYTLMLSYQNRRGENKGNRKFFIRRLFRILPMYYIGFIYYTVDSLIFAPHFHVQENMIEFNFLDSIINVLFLNNIFPSAPYYVPGGWSIVAEMTFYLSLPLLFKFITDINKAFLFLLASLATSLLFSNLLIDYHPNINSLYISFPNQLPVFALGTILFYCMNSNVQINRNIIFALPITIGLFTYFIPDKSILYCMVASSLLFFFAFIICRKKYTIIVNSFFSYVGKISYSMYLIHFGVLYWLSRFEFADFLPCTSLSLYIANYWVRYLVIFSISAVLSHFTYKYIEVRFIKKGRELIQLIK